MTSIWTVSLIVGFFVSDATFTNAKQSLQQTKPALTVVAIKVLPFDFARDADREARFQREAEILASLNHPHIGAIYGLEDLGQSRLLILELIEGETLADRIARGPIPIQKALPIAMQIAEALEAAHEKGIIHRDLKPANIKITTDEQVKVLDFGLAKIRKHEVSMPSAVTSMTAPGVILGTAAYMSPEQAQGKEADRTSDVWAFGCVLYEMLAGQRAFVGETVSEVVAAVLKGEPDWNRLPRAISEDLRRLIARCLRKEERLRLRDMRDVRIELEDERATPGERRSEPVTRTKQRFAWISALVLVAMLSAAAAWFLRPKASVVPAPELRVDIQTQPTSDGFAFAISPDGRMIVYEGISSGGQSMLWLRPLDSETARPLVGTESGINPFWKPDNTSIGFLTRDGKIKRIDIGSGSVQTLMSLSAKGSQFLGGTWNRNGDILFTDSASVFRVAEAGGDLREVTRGAAGSTLRFTKFLLDGRHFLFYEAGRVADSSAVYVGDLDGSEPQQLLRADTVALHAPSGHLLFVRDGVLFAQNFDAARLTLSGTPFRIAEDVLTKVGEAALSVATTGSVVYRTGPFKDGQAVSFDRSGNEIERVSEALAPTLGWSVHGNNLAMAPSGDISVFDVGRKVLTRLTTSPFYEGNPVWSPDGQVIAFNLNRLPPGNDIEVVSATDYKVEPLLSSSDKTLFPMDWSRDGRFLLCGTFGPGERQIFVLPLDDHHKNIGAPIALAHRGDEAGAQFSPDSHWIAYESDRSGRLEIYIRKFPGPGVRFWFQPRAATTSAGARTAMSCSTSIRMVI
jgi:serine/threonine protein kinase